MLVGRSSLIHFASMTSQGGATPMQAKWINLNLVGRESYIPSEIALPLFFWRFVTEFIERFHFESQ